MEVLNTRVWRLVPGVSLSWHDWPPHGVVFDAGSGNTHLLEEPAAQVLRAIAARPRSDAELLDMVGADATDPTAKAWLTDLLDRFIALALVDG